MTLFIKPIILLIIWAISLFAGWYPFKKKLSSGAHYDFPIGETLATGVFLGAALLHMLPEANNLFKQMGYHFPFAYIITGSVFLAFLWFEHLGQELYHSNANPPSAFAFIAWFMLSIHSFMVGAALGLSQQHSLLMMLFLATIAHKWAESFAIATQLNKSSMSNHSKLLFFFIFTLMTPLGILIGWYTGKEMETNSLFEPILIAASSGTFLYLGTLHGLERCVMVKRCCNLKDFSYVIIGFLLMAWVAIYV